MRVAALVLCRQPLASKSAPTHFYFLPAAVPLNTKPITGTNKLNSFQAGSLVSAAALALLAWFPNWHSAPGDLVSEAQRCDQNLALKALGPRGLEEATPGNSRS